ncbi:hypothetical protein LX64_00069 [Chitinophaga skermanii]|uniref:Lipoprotein n=1 Tax=Chitinophaga skermanii TaxID=331697 RepID=A0A327R970_9BACT|nr:hypothetical protein [Chitinophaga skermanii]RAJ10467.1 hypothetical protein LX64_00069 [Chitinophaga skermanii]
MPVKPILTKLLACLILLLAAACGGKKNDPKPVGAEEDLAVKLEGVIVDSEMNAAQGTTLPFAVKVTSKMPPQGVKIEVSALLTPADTNVPQNPAITTSNANTDITLIDLASLRLTNITVIVSSVSKPTNKVTFHFGVWNKVQ